MVSHSKKFYWPRGESCSKNVSHFVENYNVQICTTASERFWSKHLIKRDNALLCLPVSKTIAGNSSCVN